MNIKIIAYSDMDDLILTEVITGRDLKWSQAERLGIILRGQKPIENGLPAPDQ